MNANELQYRLLQAETYLSIERILRSVKKRMEARFNEAGLHDVTPQQAKVLMLLFQAKGALNAKDLAEELALSPVTVSRFVNSLEEHGWLKRTRQPNDARAMSIQLTDKAYNALPLFATISNQLMDEVFGDFSPNVFKEFATNVSQVRETVARLDGTAIPIPDTSHR